jgi:hypothetical protein
MNVAAAMCGWQAAPAGGPRGRSAERRGFSGDAAGDSQLAACGRRGLRCPSFGRFAETGPRADVSLGGVCSEAGLGGG